jgi:two-component system nitrogen regulation response regulator NtrX
METLREQISLAAPTDSTVLILGEHGTGKELVARQIHSQSSRSENTFIEVNCAAIPEELIESELFGHIKGSFTGATENKDGKFKAADGGTLFLDEIGDMSLKTQAKVLRALQEQTIEPVGAQKNLQVDVRVLAATNKDLNQEIESGTFRSDLYYRINVIPINVPSLRRRLSDIPALFDYFFKLYAARLGRKPKEITEEAMDMLQSYQWPGNVRELRNTAERMMIMVPNERVTEEDLKALLPMVSSATQEKTELPSEFDSLKTAREFFERHVITETLKKHDYNVAETARALQLERSHLYRKIKGYDIQINNK